MTHVNRYLEYRRSLWFSNTNNLEAHLRNAWLGLANNTDRVVHLTNGTSVMGMRHRDFNRNGFAIHCARYTEQQGVGVVDMHPLANANLGERRPGNDENFLTSDFMALIHADHVLTLNAGRNGASVRSFLQGLFKLLPLHEDTTKFDIVRIGNVDELARIEAFGVGSIGLNVAISEATADVIVEEHHKSSTFEKLLSGPRNLLDAIKGQDDKASQIGDSTKGTVKMLINVPKGDLETARSGLDGIAEELIQDEDAEDFVINLRNGETIKPGEIAVKKRVRLEKIANSVLVNDVWQEMNTYMTELRNAGQLEV